MTRKEVTFRFVFEYDTDEFPEYDDSDFESMAWDTLCQSVTDYRPQGTVETIEE
jgi:hypothetical protein